MLNGGHGDIQFVFKGINMLVVPHSIHCLENQTLSLSMSEGVLCFVWLLGYWESTSGPYYVREQLHH